MVLLNENGDGTPSRDRMADARRTIRELAEEGYTIGEITARFQGGLTEPEHEFVWRTACAETRRARGEGGR